MRTMAVWFKNGAFQTGLHEMDLRLFENSLFA